MKRQDKNEINKSFGFPVYDNYATGAISNKSNNVIPEQPNDLSIIYVSVNLSSSDTSLGIVSGGGEVY